MVGLVVVNMEKVAEMRGCSWLPDDDFPAMFLLLLLLNDSVDLDAFPDICLLPDSVAFDAFPDPPLLLNELAFDDLPDICLLSSVAPPLSISVSMADGAALLAFDVFARRWRPERFAETFDSFVK